MQHFLNITDHSPETIRGVLVRALALRAERRATGQNAPVLAGRALAMLFEKPSLRTRVSFEQAMNHLGGHAVVLGRDEVGLGKRESVADVARVLGGMVEGIAARVFSHAHLETLAAHAGVPVVNMLSEVSHPAQALADALTLADVAAGGPEAAEADPVGALDAVAGLKVVFVGDGNNVARSLMRVCGVLGAHFALACPEGYALDDAGVVVSHDAVAAVADADVLYADTFVSMGEEDQKDAKIKAFGDFVIDQKLLGAAPGRAVVLHCLPAYRGVEITDAVMDGAQSRVFAQAHNRLHAQKGLLAELMAPA